eukprot:TRINITY_DN1289_c0_g1_i1.p1 TRINITY_DN1289_c0_g1~~TRINITY_DN1289_c0_g1_i1.p1  ORF type:complete len:378 (+),score=22.38 TRINITY_DN1289_c0_g1_i1:234-1367(+)
MRSVLLNLMTLAMVIGTCPPPTFKLPKSDHCVCPKRYDCTGCSYRCASYSFNRRCSLKTFPESCKNCTCTVESEFMSGHKHLGNLRDLRHEPICKYRPEQMPNFENPHNYEFIFTVTNGHSGTKFFGSQSSWKDTFAQLDPSLVVLHEQEPDLQGVMHLTFQPDFCTRALDYVINRKVPHLLRTLERKNGRVLYQSGHTVNSGLLPALLAYLGPHVKLVRLRRDRIDTAWSWSKKPTGPCNRCWNCACPFDLNTRCPIDGQHWDQMTRFEQYLWTIDEVECLWQSIRHQFPDVPVYQLDWYGKVNVVHMAALAKFLLPSAHFYNFPRPSHQLEPKNVHLEPGQTRNTTLLQELDMHYRKLTGLADCDRYHCIGPYVE